MRRLWCFLEVHSLTVLIYFYSTEKYDNQNVFCICINHPGLEQHEGNNNGFHFWVNYSLKFPELKWNGKDGHFHMWKLQMDMSPINTMHT